MSTDHPPSTTTTTNAPPHQLLPKRKREASTTSRRRYASTSSRRSSCRSSSSSAAVAVRQRRGELIPKIAATGPGKDETTAVGGAVDAVTTPKQSQRCVFGLLRSRRYLPALVGHASLLCPRAALDRLRTLAERPGWVRRAADGREEEAAVHYKFAPMLDPQYQLLGRYDVAERAELPSHAYREYVTRHQKIMDPMNSAAMDALGAHLSGELFRQGLPTAIESFGYRVGLKQRFSYDVGTECMYLCHEWDRPENAHRFAWCNRPADYAERKAELLLDEQRRRRRDKEKDAAAKEDEDEDEYYYDDEDDISCSSSNAPDDDGEYDEDDEDDDGWWSYRPGEATVDLFNIPVVMVAMEQCAGGTLEDLLKTRRAAGDPFTEAETESLVMQLLFTLTAFQHHWGMVHGDLHLRNILVVPTSDAALQFAFGGVIYSVPSFGRIYKLVDFGRSSFVVDGRTFISDAFMPYGDGYGMYNCGAGEDRRRRTVAPSRSFDLGLLSGSLFELLVGGDFMADWAVPAPRSFVDSEATPAQRAVYSWGIMRRQDCVGGAADDDAAAAAFRSADAACLAADPDLADEMVDDDDDDDEEEEEENGGDADDAAAAAAADRTMELFRPEWDGQHSVFLDNGAPRFSKNHLFHANRIVARFVHGAVPADLLAQYLRPETRTWQFSPPTATE